MITADVTRTAPPADLGPEIAAVAARVLEDGAAEIVRAAQDRIGPGNLANSIAAEEGGDPLQWTVRARAPYARFVEFGTRRMAARPYLGPAVRRVWPGVVALMKKILPGSGS